MGSFAFVIPFLALGLAANSVLASEPQLAAEMTPIAPKGRNFRNAPRTVSPLPPHYCPGRFRATSPEFFHPNPQHQLRPPMTDDEYLKLILPLGIDLNESMDSSETPSNSPVSRGESSSDCEAPAQQTTAVLAKKSRKASSKSLTKSFNGKSLDKMQILLPVLIPFLMAMGTLFTVIFLQQLSQQL